MTNKTKKLIVNGLTLSRLIVSFILPFVFMRVDMSILLSLLAIVFLTDFFDGKLARKWEVQTMGGSLLDPLGDKMLAISCILALVGFHKNYAILMISELFICILNIFRTVRGENVKSSFIGRFKTWVLGITLGFGAVNVFFPNIFNVLVSFIGVDTDALLITSEFVNGAIMVTVGVELVTIAIYFKEAITSKKEQRSSFGEWKSIREILVRLFDEQKFSEDKNRPLVEILKK